MTEVKQLPLCIGLTTLFFAIDVRAEDLSIEKEVSQLETQVVQLKQQIMDLSAQQQSQAVKLKSYTAPAVQPQPAPKASSNKPGWITLPDGETQLKIYGNIRTDATYDFAGSNSRTNDVYNRTNFIPLNGENAVKNTLNVSAATSRIGLDLVRPTPKGQLKAKLEADFMGGGASIYTNNTGSFRVRHAFVELNEWLVGQTVSIFLNHDTRPDVVDANGPMGSGPHRTVQLRYTQSIKKNQKFLVALEGGDVDNFTGRSQTNGGGRLPALTTRYDWATEDKKGLIQVHGLLHEQRASNNNDNVVTKLSYGIGLAGKYTFDANNLVLFNYYHIKGDRRYMLHTSNSYVIATSNNGKNYKILESEFDSLLLGYSRKWSSKWRSTFAASKIWYNDSNAFAKAAPSANKEMYNLSFSTFYTPVKSVDLGVEYAYGERQTFSLLDGEYSRLGFMMRYTF